MFMMSSKTFWYQRAPWFRPNLSALLAGAGAALAASSFLSGFSKQALAWCCFGFWQVFQALWWSFPQAFQQQQGGGRDVAVLALAV